MSNCENCRRWTVKRETRYADGSVIQNWSAVSGEGACEKLGISTKADFGCNSFMEADAGSHVETTVKLGAPWQNWRMDKCPDCSGKGCHMVELRPACNRCVGGGQVRHYDDGFVGDERTRRHPKEAAPPAPKCPECKREVAANWKHCPDCGFHLHVEEKESGPGAGEAFEPAPPPVAEVQ